MNVLWIMADQLRWDYLSCYGATHMETPNLDWLASQGVRFNKAYVQSPICGPSRMSYYTGRYVRSPAPRSMARRSGWGSRRWASICATTG